VAVRSQAHVVPRRAPSSPWSTPTTPASTPTGTSTTRPRGSGWRPTSRSSWSRGGSPSAGSSLPYTVRSLLVDDHQVTAAGDLVAATRARGAPVYVGSRAVVAGTVGFALHRGVVAVATVRPPSIPGQLLTAASGIVDCGRTTARRRPRGSQRPREHRGPVPQRRRVRGARRPPGVRPAPIRSTAGRSGSPSGMSSTSPSPGWSRGRPGSTRCGPPVSSWPRSHHARRPTAVPLPSASPSSRRRWPARGTRGVWLCCWAPRDRA
jgi:hypothetical protein